ncbi:hypothetical protein CROQUDRAFT_462564 [Cronartium quercuum f. sp. fusiforme G11]|uniref:Uncharacterized protein n=1 Tax=Cronartium quercuum f. sp. fusiforme G11 TaxID=708437 RepID=A0A9P6TGE7_9BASI|nr:hypothetical protein CROQUDRAFT_462564 [Cronartium quercuum f. sp. fusiforme G11]
MGRVSWQVEISDRIQVCQIRQRSRPELRSLLILILIFFFFSFLQFGDVDCRIELRWTNRGWTRKTKGFGFKFRSYIDRLKLSDLRLPRLVSEGSDVVRLGPSLDIKQCGVHADAYNECF